MFEGSGLLADALALALQLQHPAYDGFYLALALRADAPLMPADKRPYDRCMTSDAGRWRDRDRLLGAVPA